MTSDKSRSSTDTEVLASLLKVLSGLSDVERATLTSKFGLTFSDPPTAPELLALADIPLADIRKLEREAYARLAKRGE